MTRADARKIVRSLRRQFVLSFLTAASLAAVLGLTCAWILLGIAGPKSMQTLWSAASLAGLMWMLLTLLSARQVKAANQAAAFLSAGRLDLAEQELTSALHAFSLYRTGKLLVCHNLAVVVHGQKNYQAAAELCDGIVSLQRGVSRGLGRVCRMLLADCRLCLGDTPAACKALAPLMESSSALSLAEQLMLLPIELRYQIARKDYAAAVENLSTKVRRAELLDSPRAALAHALLAKACRQVSLREAGDFLRRRAELYHDMAELEKDFPNLLD